MKYCRDLPKICFFLINFCTNPVEVNFLNNSIHLVFFIDFSVGVSSRSKQKLPTSFPKSTTLFFLFNPFNLAKTEAIDQTPPYLWPGSKGWIRAHKRAFNLQRRKTQIGRSLVYGFVSFAPNKLNKKILKNNEPF